MEEMKIFDEINSKNTGAESLKFRSPRLEEMMYLQNEAKNDINIPARLCAVLILFVPMYLMLWQAQGVWYLLTLLPIAGLILSVKLKKNDRTDDLNIMVLYGTVMDKFIERHGSANAYYVSVWVDETQQFCSRINFRGGKTGSYNALMPGEKVLIYKSGDRIAAKPVPLPLMQYAAPENNENIR